MTNAGSGSSHGTPSGPRIPAGPRWLLSRSNPDGRLRLFCLPYAGGGASMFRDWPRALPKEIDVCLVQLPGRETRARETPMDRLTPLVEAVLGGLSPMLETPFALFGHSMGALIAFELARELRRRGLRGPVHLFVSGLRAPQFPDPDPPLHELPEPELVSALARLNGTPKEILENAELMEYLLPLLRCDLAVCETYRYTEAAPLPCPITVLGGTHDSKAPRETLSGWQDQTTHPCRIHVFDGDHFFLNQSRAEILQVLAEELEKALSRL